jgi:hypothetical protein
LAQTGTFGAQMTRCTRFKPSSRRVALLLFVTVKPRLAALAGGRSRAQPKGRTR